MINKEKNAPREFFAAQNSYYGFISRFREIFDSKKYERIFVLKGGPGTGKSSIMKKTASTFSGFADVYKIYCSSDINSLDGVIIETKRSRVAILDGTAPHERDAVIPGAIDELVNLGVCWREGELIEKRDAILSINLKKSKHYQSAYGLLSIAGMYNERLKNRVQTLFDSDNSKIAIAGICEGLSVGKSEKSCFLLSAFGKGGHEALESALRYADEVVRVEGKYSSETLFMNILSEEFRKRGIRHTAYPSPLDTNEIETVFVSRGEKTIAYTTLPLGKSCFANEFLRYREGDVKEAELFYSEREKYKRLASEQFLLASGQHFLLEDIYTPAMNFDMINEICELIEKKVRKAIE